MSAVLHLSHVSGKGKERKEESRKAEDTEGSEGNPREKGVDCGLLVFFGHSGLDEGQAKCGSFEGLILALGSIRTPRRSGFLIKLLNPSSDTCTVKKKVK